MLKSLEVHFHYPRQYTPQDVLFNLLPQNVNFNCPTRNASNGYRCETRAFSKRLVLWTDWQSFWKPTKNTRLWLPNQRNLNFLRKKTFQLKLSKKALLLELCKSLHSIVTNNWKYARIYQPAGVLLLLHSSQLVQDLVPPGLLKTLCSILSIQPSDLRYLISGTHSLKPALQPSLPQRSDFQLLKLCSKTAWLKIVEKNWWVCSGDPDWIFCGRFCRFALGDHCRHCVAR